MTPGELGTRCHELRSVAMGKLIRSGYDRAEAEVAVSDAILSVLTTNAPWNNKSSLATWYVRICINAALMNRRRDRTTIRRNDLAVPLGEAYGLPAYGPSQLAQLLQGERADMVLDAVAALPDHYRCIVFMRFWDLPDATLAEIGEAIGVSLPVAKGRLHRGIRILRTSMKFGHFRRESKMYSRSEVAARPNPFSKGGMPMEMSKLTKKTPMPVDQPADGADSTMPKKKPASKKKRLRKLASLSGL